MQVINETPHGRALKIDRSASVLGLHEFSLLSRIQAGEIKAVRANSGEMLIPESELERLEEEEGQIKTNLVDLAKRQAPVERVSDDARSFLETWQDIGELLEAAMPEERLQLLQHYIEVVELGTIDPETRTGSYAMRLFPEVRPDRGFDFGGDNGPDDGSSGPEMANGDATKNGCDPVAVNPGRFGSHNRPESSPSRTRTYNKPVNSRLLYH